MRGFNVNADRAMDMVEEEEKSQGQEAEGFSFDIQCVTTVSERERVYERTQG